MADDDNWIFYYRKSETIPNIDRMPINHLVCPREGRRVLRQSTHKQQTNKSQTGFHSSDIDRRSQRLDSELFSEFDFKVPDSDSDKEDTGSDHKGKSESEVVYINACKHCRVPPGKRILSSLNSQNVSVKGKCLPSKDVEPIIYALTENSCVTTVDVSGNSIGRDGLFNILRLLEVNRSITFLDNYSGCPRYIYKSDEFWTNADSWKSRGGIRCHGGVIEIREERILVIIGTDILTTAIEQNISHNRLGSEGAIILESMIANNGTLKTLEAAGNSFIDDDAIRIANGLKFTKSLMSINLSQNNFTETGGQGMTDAIENNETLTELNLSWNHLRLGGAEAIAKSLSNNFKLKALYLAWNGFANDGCKEMSVSLENNSTLELLDLSNNRIGHEGARYLSKALGSNSTLKHLKLNMNSLATLGAMELLVAIRDNEESAIHTLELKEVPVLESAISVIEEIKSSRPRFNVIHDVKVSSDDFLASVTSVKKPCRSKKKNLR